MLFGLTLHKLFFPNLNTGRIKTETRRRIKFGEQKMGDDGIIYENGHPKYWEGKIEPIRATWDGESIGNILITSVEWEDVRTISNDAIHREGFTLCYEFLERWVMMHDKEIFPSGLKLDGRTKQDYEARKKMLLMTSDRTGENALRYMAWIIKFKVLTESLNLKHYELKKMRFNLDEFKEIVSEQHLIPSIETNGGTDFLEYFYPEIPQQTDHHDPNEFKKRITLYDAIQYSMGSAVDQAVEENRIYTQQPDNLF